MFNLDWTSVIESGDAESIWNAIYSLVRERNPIHIYPVGRSEHLFLDEVSSDIAQEVFLRLITGDRLASFQASGYTSDQIESELILNELADVLISRTCKPISSESNGARPSPGGCEELAFQTAPARKPA